MMSQARKFTLPLLTLLLLAPPISLRAIEVRTETWTEKWPDKSGQLQTISVTAEVWTQVF